MEWIENLKWSYYTYLYYLKIPNYDDSFDYVIGETYKTDLETFHKIVREFVRIYASKNKIKNSDYINNLILLFCFFIK